MNKKNPRKAFTCTGCESDPLPCGELTEFVVIGASTWENFICEELRPFSFPNSCTQNAGLVPLKNHCDQ